MVVIAPPNARGISKARYREEVVYGSNSTNGKLPPPPLPPLSPLAKPPVVAELPAAKISGTPKKPDKEPAASPVPAKAAIKTPLPSETPPGDDKKKVAADSTAQQISVVPAEVKTPGSGEKAGASSSAVSIAGKDLRRNDNGQLTTVQAAENGERSDQTEVLTPMEIGVNATDASLLNRSPAPVLQTEHKRSRRPMFSRLVKMIQEKKLEKQDRARSKSEGLVLRNTGTQRKPERTHVRARLVARWRERRKQEV
jgi:hypothetical protein